jgi:flagellar motor switch protein FliM
MRQVLSEDEIEQLLTAINASDKESDDIKSAPDTRKIKIYDFKRPDKFSLQQIRAISIIHDTFSRLISDSLSAKLRSMVHVHVASVDQLTHEEFIRTLPTPTTMAIMDMAPLKGGAVLEIDPAITFAIIDRICGGFGGTTKFNHELSDIETSVMKGVIGPMLGNLSEAWAAVLDLRPSLRQIDTNPQFVQLVSPTDMVILITQEANIGGVVGMINICIPYTTIEPIIEKLPFCWWQETVQNSTVSADLDDVPVRMTAEVLRRDYPLKEILKWDAKTLILPLRPLSPGYCYLRLGDRRVWQCQILPDSKWFPKRITIVNYAEKPFGTEGNMEMGKVNPLVADALSSAMMRVSVELGATNKTVKEVYAISEGTILELDKLAGEPLDVKVNGIIIAKGEPVVIDENFGIRIIEIIGTHEASGQSGTQQSAPDSPEPTAREST